MLGWFRKKTFWDWFAKNAERIKASDDIQAMGAEIAHHFQQQYPGLYWEIARKKGEPWDFCVSANGERAKFTKVESAVRDAPKIDGWNIRAFRQRGSLGVKIRMGARSLAVDDIWCTTKPLEGGIALTLWIAGLDDENENMLGGAAAVLLDNVVGEYDAVMKIRALERGALPQDPAGKGLVPLRDLPGLLDAISPTS